MGYIERWQDEEESLVWTQHHESHDSSRPSSLEYLLKPIREGSLLSDSITPPPPLEHVPPNLKFGNWEGDDRGGAKTVLLDPDR